jgi:hypothetical protein
LPLRISSEPVYDRVLPLHQTTNFLPPSDLPHTNFVEENANEMQFWVIQTLLIAMHQCRGEGIMRSAFSAFFRIFRIFLHFPHNFSILFSFSSHVPAYFRILSRTF